MTQRVTQQHGFRWARTSACVALALLVTSPVAVLLAAKIQAQADPKFDFSTIRTWSWNPVGAGEVHVVISKESKSEPVKRQYEPILMQAIEDQFGVRGYPKESGASPDFVVTYRLLITAGMAAHEMGQFLPATVNFGLPLFTPQTTALKVYPVGTLIVDAGLNSGTKTIWRGMAEAKIDIENSEPKREARIKSVVKELVSKFPKRK